MDMLNGAYQKCFEVFGQLCVRGNSLSYDLAGHSAESVCVESAIGIYEDHGGIPAAYGDVTVRRRQDGEGSQVVQ
jgi:hypothetical protein